MFIIIFFYSGTQFPGNEKKLRYAIQKITKMKLLLLLLVFFSPPAQSL